MIPASANIDRIQSLILALDLPETHLARVVEQVAVLREAIGTFDAVFVTSSQDLSLFARFGFGIEHVMSYDDWCKVQDPSRWVTYLEERLRAAVMAHRPSNVLIAGNIPAADALDRNLYGCLLRLTPEGVQGDRIDAVTEELTFLNLNLISIEKKIDKIVRTVRPKSFRSKLTRRVRRAMRRRRAVVDDQIGVAGLKNQSGLTESTTDNEPASQDPL